MNRQSTQCDVIPPARRGGSPRRRRGISPIHATCSGSRAPAIFHDISEKGAILRQSSAAVGYGWSDVSALNRRPGGRHSLARFCASRARVCPVETTVGILLRKRQFSDSSLIVSWCTDSLGYIQTMAKGARRSRSGFAGKLDLFFEAEIQIARSRKSSLHTLTEVVLRNPFAGIRKNYERTQTAAYFVELIELCTERDHHEPELFGLLQRAFTFLNTHDSSLRVVSHFEKELARIAGVYDSNLSRSNPAFALGNLFGKLPISRTPLLKQLENRTKAAVSVLTNKS
jgi:DNA repair protein RecO (recombination protein O)